MNWPENVQMAMRRLVHGIVIVHVCRQKTAHYSQVPTVASSPGPSGGGGGGGGGVGGGGG